MHFSQTPGGPCSGKTTALTHLADRLSASGFRVFRVPEAATLLINGGYNYGEMSPEQIGLAQRELLRVQLALENAMIRYVSAFVSISVTVFNLSSFSVWLRSLTEFVPASSFVIEAGWMERRIAQKKRGKPI